AARIDRVMDMNTGKRVHRIGDGSSHADATIALSLAHNIVLPGESESKRGRTYCDSSLDLCAQGRIDVQICLLGRSANTGKFNSKSDGRVELIRDSAVEKAPLLRVFGSWQTYEHLGAHLIVVHNDCSVRGYEVIARCRHTTTQENKISERINSKEV